MSLAVRKKLDSTTSSSLIVVGPCRPSSPPGTRYKWKMCEVSNFVNIVGRRISYREGLGRIWCLPDICTTEYINIIYILLWKIPGLFLDENRS